MPAFNAAFWKWFKGSLVVDASGDPLVVYHGTRATFTEFETRRSKSQNRMGAYFTASKVAAERFARIRGGRVVLAVYLRMERPLDVRGVAREDIAAAAGMHKHAQWDALTQGRAGPYATLEWLDAQYNLVPSLKRRGYDGIIFDDEVDGDTYVVFAPTQIKLAEGNDGTWDADDPDIKSNPPMLPAHKGERWFHATDQDAAGRSILASGMILASQPKGKGMMAPRAGFAYMSRSLSTASIYALGGVMMGTEYDEKYWRNGRYGWIFEVDTSGPIDVEPDEDEVGEILSRYLEKGVLDWQGIGYWLVQLAREHVAPSRLRAVEGGEYAYFASVGKQLLRKMTDEQKLDIMALSKNLAVRGGTKFIRAWRLDKALAPKIHQDGSNVLEIAERVR